MIVTENLQKRHKDTCRHVQACSGVCVHLTQPGSKNLSLPQTHTLPNESWDQTLGSGLQTP